MPGSGTASLDPAPWVPDPYPDTIRPRDHPHPDFTDGGTKPQKEEGAFSGHQVAQVLLGGRPSHLTWERAPVCLSRTLGCLVEEMRGGGLEMVGGRGRTGRALSWRPRGSG